MRHQRIFLGLALFLVLSLGTGVWAQDKVYDWDRLDVDITVRPNGDMRIIETQQYTYVVGRFSYGYRNIPMGRLDRITDVQVWEGDRQYRPGQGGDYTFETFTEEGEHHYYCSIHSGFLLPSGEKTDEKGVVIVR